MEKQVTFWYYNEENDTEEEITVGFPAKNVVCYDCGGNGTTYLGWAARDQPAFTREDFDYEGPEFYEDYMEGKYDGMCPCCNGNKVVLEIQPEWISKDKKELWKAYCEHLECEAAHEAEVRAERRYFYGY